eukprot:sb/3462216/
MTATPSPSSANEENKNPIVEKRHKIRVAKLVFAAGIGTIGLLAGFKMGYSSSKKKYGMTGPIKGEGVEDPVKLASRALKKATLITVSCFVVGIGGVALASGLYSLKDWKNFSRRKWREEEQGSSDQGVLKQSVDSIENDIAVLESHRSSEPCSLLCSNPLLQNIGRVKFTLCAMSYRSRGTKWLSYAIGAWCAHRLITTPEIYDVFEESILMPCAARLDPEVAHRMALYAVRSKIAPRDTDYKPACLRTTVMGMTFNNPIGLAAGFDKDCEATKSLHRLGFGFIEGGSVTPKPQSGNPKPRVFRFTAAIKGAAVAIVGGIGTKGVIRLVQDEDSVCVDGTVSGLELGQFQVSVNEFGDISNACLSTGPILSSADKVDQGILGVIEADGSAGETRFFSESQNLDISDCIGRSLVLQSVDGSKKVACGIIGRSPGVAQNSKRICACDGKVIWEEQHKRDMTATPSSTNEENKNPILEKRHKIRVAKLVFAAGIGTIGLLAGFKMGYSSSKKKYGMTGPIKGEGVEDPVKLASRALKKATLITVSCFVIGIGGVALASGLYSLKDWKNFSVERGRTGIVRSGCAMSYRSRGTKWLSYAIGAWCAHRLITTPEIYDVFEESILMPCAARLDPEVAHRMALYAVRSKIAPRDTDYKPACLRTTVMGMTFNNPIGLAAGFDKDCEATKSLHRLGFGFIEGGSVTPKPQPGNPKPRVFRLSEDQAVINCYGFPSKGLDAVEKNLRRSWGSADLMEKAASRNGKNGNGGGTPAAPGSADAPSPVVLLGLGLVTDDVSSTKVGKVQ